MSARLSIDRVRATERVACPYDERQELRAARRASLALMEVVDQTQAVAAETGTQSEREEQEETDG